MAGDKDTTEVVYMLSRPSRCFNCDRRLEPGDLARLQDSQDEREVRCRTCANLDKLELLPAGNAKITRLVKKYSSVLYVVVKWSETWKCYERQGLLAEPQSIDRACAETGITLNR